MPKSIECEIALVIRSSRAAKIADELAGLVEIGGYSVTKDKTQRIRDIYFDTSARDLQARKSSLRIRRVNGETRITFKGASTTVTWGGRTRTEIELAWSRQAVVRILKKLRKQKIPLEPLGDKFQATAPLKTMRQLGFQVIQDRSTLRRVRNLTTRDHATTFAELAIDAVTFYFGDQAVRVREIEIESKADGSQRRLHNVVKNLRATYERVLYPAPSKLSLGRAIQARLIEGQRLTDRRQNLTPAGLDQIRKRIKL
jgi:predicted adenylyl cyclase CyaB